MLQEYPKHGRMVNLEICKVDSGQNIWLMLQPGLQRFYLDHDNFFSQFDELEKLRHVACFRKGPRILDDVLIKH